MVLSLLWSPLYYTGPMVLLMSQLDLIAHVEWLDTAFGHSVPPHLLLMPCPVNIGAFHLPSIAPVLMNKPVLVMRR